VVGTVFRVVGWTQTRHLPANQKFQMSAPNRFKKLDVRPALSRGEEPYPEIRRRIATLGPGEGLMLTAPFLPAPLIERLKSEGFTSRAERGGAGDWITYFWRETD